MLANTRAFNESFKPATGGVVQFLNVTCTWLTVGLRYEISAQTRVSLNKGSEVMQTRTSEVSENFQL